MKDRPCKKPWHFEARRLQAQGMTGSEIARIVGVTGDSVRLFLNPFAYRKSLLARSARVRKRYAEDPEYRAKLVEKSRQQRRSKHGNVDQEQGT